MKVWLPDRRVTRWGDARWVDERRIAFPAQAWEAEGFWREQERIADIAWRFAARQPPVPPENTRGSAGHERRRFARRWRCCSPNSGARSARRSASHGIADRRLRAFVDAQLLISAQATAHECAWLYGAVALDFARIGAHYVEGGAWSLARTLAAAFARDGGELRYRTLGQAHPDARWPRDRRRDRARRAIFAGQVVANMTLWDAARLLGQAAPPGCCGRSRARRAAGARVRSTWAWTRRPSRPAWPSITK